MQIVKMYVRRAISKKIIKNSHIYYTFAEDEDSVISVLYTKISIKDYDWILSIIWPTRVNYKQNVSVLRKIIQGL